MLREFRLRNAGDISSITGMSIESLRRYRRGGAISADGVAAIEKLRQWYNSLPDHLCPLPSTPPVQTQSSTFREAVERLAALAPEGFTIEVVLKQKS